MYSWEWPHHLPTTRRRRLQGRRLPVSKALAHYFACGAFGPPDGGIWGPGTGRWEVLAADSETLAARWAEVRDAYLDAWRGEHPGTRPFIWWRLEAAEHRRRVGGIGTPAHEVGNYQEFPFGVPACWVELDPADPPRYEGQATFLDRHGLLTAAERRALPPGAFKPEAIRDQAPDDDEADATT
jgi:hypothetical protein